jgi:hypothetical protein
LEIAADRVQIHMHGDTRRLWLRQASRVLSTFGELVHVA